MADGEQNYEVEFESHVYVTVPVTASGPEAAVKAAEKVLPKYPVVASPADGCPPETVVIGPGKHWAVNMVTDEDEEIVWER